MAHGPRAARRAFLFRLTPQVAEDLIEYNCTFNAGDDLDAPSFNASLDMDIEHALERAQMFGMARRTAQPQEAVFPAAAGCNPQTALDIRRRLPALGRLVYLKRRINLVDNLNRAGFAAVVAGVDGGAAIDRV